METSHRLVTGRPEERAGGKQPTGMEHKGHLVYYGENPNS